MKFRTKVLLLFFGLTLTGNAVLSVINYHQTRSQVRAQIESTALAIAASASAALDGERLASLRDPRQLDVVERNNLLHDLRRIRDEHRSQGLHLRRIYAVIQDALDPKRLRYAVDTDDADAVKPTPGLVYERPDGFLPDQVSPYLLPDMTAADGAEWLTALAPVSTREGQTVGFLGVDLGTGALTTARQRLLSSAAAGMLISLVLAVVFSSVMMSWISRPLAAVREALRNIGRGRMDADVDLRSNDEFGEVADAIDGMRVGLMQRENLKGALASYVSEEVTQSILSGGNRPAVRGERKRITVLFADVRGFTGLSERMAPEQVVEMLNEFLGRMVDTVQNNHGFLNKFLGDGLMAVFGANRDDPDQEIHAVQCALDMLQSTSALRDRWKHQEGRADEHDLRIGIGVCTGDAVVGNIGCEQKLEYTAVGDTVNLAARLEASTKEYPGTDVLVSEATYKAACGAFDFVSVGQIFIRGKRRPVTAYTVPLYQHARITPK